LVSRGQQKLLACALILAATEVVQTHLERPLRRRRWYRLTWRGRCYFCWMIRRQSWMGNL
jgi:hypothetical protein